MEVKKIKQFYPRNRKEWRNWLERNHKKEKAIALIRYKKHTGKPSLSVQEAMHEAICFGWIDTTVKRLDDERYIINYKKRNEKTSRWSDNTLRYARELIKEGKMSPEGLRFYKLGLAKPTHHHGIPNNPRMPFDFKKELEKQGLFREYQNLPPSLKKMNMRWLYRAKRPETRIKRINEIIKIVKKRDIK